MANTRSRKKTDEPGSSEPKAPVRRKIRGSGVMTKVIAEVNEKYGQGSIVKSTELYKFMRHIPLGNLIADMATFGGLMEGQAAMFLGPPGGGKTTQAMKCVAEMQKKYPDKVALWVDSEETFDPVWAAMHGVDMERLEIARIKAGEDVTDMMKTLKAEAEELGLLVLDSVNQTIPLKEYVDSAGDAQVAIHAKMMSRMVAALTTASKDRRANGYEPVTEIFINQYRDNIGGGPMAGLHIPGGRAIRHYCSTWLEYKAIIADKADDEKNTTPYDVRMLFKAKRTKVASTLRTGEYRIVVGPDHPLPIGAIDEAGTVITQAKKAGLWTGAGQKQRLIGVDKNFKNMDAGADYLEDFPDEMLRIKREILMHRRTRVGMNALPPDGYLFYHATAD